MKKIYIAASLLLAAATLASCSGHSESDARQIEDAHQQAHDMFDGQNPAAVPDTASSASAVFN